MLDAQAISLVRAGLKSVLAEDDGPETIARSFYAHLFAEHPEFRSFFPAAMEQQRHRLVRALEYVIDNLEDPNRFLPFLHQLGRDHRKHGIDGRHFLAAENALVSAFRSFVGTEVWTETVEAAWRTTFGVVSNSMAAGADSDRMPAYWGATVVEHRRVLDDLAIIRVQTDGVVPYEPGQYVSVQVPQRPRMWRYLSPAIPTNDHGGIEFHVRRVSGGWVSPALVADTVVGDRWLVGPPLGGLNVDTSPGCEDVLMIAGGTGLAPLRAQLMAMAMRSRNPRVHLFVSGQYPSDLYDIETLWHLAQTNPWLTVVPVVEDTEEPWWRPDAHRDIPRGLYHLQVGKVGQVVTRYGSWADRQIQICGSPSMVRSTTYALRLVGTPVEHIQFDPTGG